MTKKKTGTKEWSDFSHNIQCGCEHDCLYCYAKAMSIRFGRCEARDWKDPGPYKYKRIGKRKGIVMFPTTHDITPSNIGEVLHDLREMLRVGNRVLVVSKPHFSCIERICACLRESRNFLEFRFSIGATSDRILGFWEPGAPSFAERIKSLAFAWSYGFHTSVSCEPLLVKDWMHYSRLIESVLPFVTGKVWVGIGRNMVQRVRMNRPGDTEAEIEARDYEQWWDSEKRKNLVYTLSEHWGDRIALKDSLRGL